MFVLNVVDGCNPSDMATDAAEEIEEERRLLYVAMTRARDDLVLMQPLRFYVRGQGYGGDRSIYAPRSRFIAESDLEAFELTGAPQQQTRVDAPLPSASVNVDLRPGCARCGVEPGPAYRDKWRLSSSSAAAANACMFSTRSALPVSMVMTSSASPAMAMQLCPALSP